MATKIDQQLKHNDCGISAVKIIYNLHNLHINRTFIVENIYLTDSGSSLSDIKDFFDKQHFVTSLNLLDVNSLKFTPENINKYLPCILPLKSTSGQHYVVIESVHNKKVKVLDPEVGQSFKWSFTELMNRTYTATANYDYVSNSQILQHTINEELMAYGMSPDEIEEHDKGEVINKLTYFSYIKQNF